MVIEILNPNQTILNEYINRIQQFIKQLSE